MLEVAHVNALLGNSYSETMSLTCLRSPDSMMLYYNSAL